MGKAKFKIRKGDQVVVIAGRNKGAKGAVLAVMPSECRVIVQGVNTIKKHVKPSAAGGGGIETKEAPIHISNVALADPKSGKPSRVGYKTLKDGRKVRVARQSGETVE